MTSGAARSSGARVDVGDEFGRWTVEADAGQRRVGSESQLRRHVRVRCACGSKRVLAARELQRGRATGCGDQNCRRVFEARQKMLSAAHRSGLGVDAIERLLEAFDEENREGA